MYLSSCVSCLFLCCAEPFPPSLVARLSSPPPAPPMSDSDNDDRARRGPSREVGGALPTSASEARSVVHQFVKDVQPRHIRSRQKEHITAFAKWSCSQPLRNSAVANEAVWAHFWKATNLNPHLLSAALLCFRCL